MSDQSTLTLCSNIQWSNPQSHGLQNVHASLSTGEIQTLLSQRGWHIHTGPTLLIDQHVFKISERWTWYQGRRVLGFNHWYWDEVLECSAWLIVNWWILNNVLKLLALFLRTLLIPYRQGPIEHCTSHLITFTILPGFHSTISASSGQVLHTAISSMSTMAD